MMKLINMDTNSLSTGQVSQHMNFEITW